MGFPERITSNDHQRLMDEYAVKCTGHFDSLIEMPIKCCCGRTVETDYYRFTRAPKSQPESGATVFFAGSGCGGKINKLIGIAPPPKMSLFLPDDHQATLPESAALNSNETSDLSPKVKYSPINMEVVQACSLLQILLERYRIEALDNLLERTRKTPNRTPSEKEIALINKIAGGNFKVAKYGGLAAAIKALSCNNKKRGIDFSFPLLNRELLRLNISTNL